MAGDKGEPDSLNLASSDSSKKSTLDHLTGVRAIGNFWIFIAHFATVEKGSSNKLHMKLLANGHIALCIFAIASGFSMQWTHGSFSYMPAWLSKESNCGKFLACCNATLWWWLIRLSRVVLAGCAGMAVAWFVDIYYWYASGTDASSIPGFFISVVGFWFHMWTMQRAYDGGWIYPNAVLWFIAAIFWSWVFFPIFTPLIRVLGKPPVGPKGWPLMLLIPIFAVISYIPVWECLHEIGWTHNGTLGGSWYNYIENAPQAEMPDFYLGCIAAAVAKMYKPQVTKYLESTTSEHSLWRRFVAPLACHLACDAMAAIVIWRSLHYVPNDSEESDYDYLYVENYHAASLPIALYFLFSTVTGGYGIMTVMLKSAPLVAIGRYALYIYVFQIPISRLFYGAFNGGPTEDDIKLEGDQFFLFVIIEGAFAAAYAECLEEPFANGVSSLLKPLVDKFKAPGL
jgi:hypothetical protein